jgi:transcriptional regulator with XRE-family HTH domain
VDPVIVQRWTGVESRALRLALRLSVRDFAAGLGVGFRTVAKWEAAGAKITPRPEMQEALDTALARAPDETKIRFSLLLRSRKEPAREEDATNRRQLLVGGLGASGLAILATADGQTDLASADDDQLLTLLPAAYRRLEQRIASRLLIAPVTAHLALIRQLAATTEVNDERHRRLSGLVSETAGLAAWLYVDLDEQANARRHYQMAVKAAERTEHPLLPVYMQASMGQFAAWCGEAQQGLRLIGEARARLQKAPPIATAWLDTLEAAALAESGNVRALDKLDRAEKHLDAVKRDDPVWPWIFRFDAPKLAGYRAVAAAKLGRIQTADAAFKVAASAESAPKQRALLDVEHARALAAKGNFADACKIAVAAYTLGKQANSERVLHAVARFRSGLGSRGGRAVDELDHWLSSRYEEDL